MSRTPQYEGGRPCPNPPAALSAAMVLQAKDDLQALDHRLAAVRAARDAAVATLQAAADAVHAYRQAVSDARAAVPDARAAADWTTTPYTRGIISFNLVCDALRYEPASLRKRILSLLSPSTLAFLLHHQGNCPLCTHSHKKPRERTTPSSLPRV
ncbi:MAG: hypothetical protein ACOY3P_20325 [Planctomycetota bacterium]